MQWGALPDRPPPVDGDATGSPFESGLLFCIHEKDIEVLARQMLLILVLFDISRDGDERVKLFLEIYGNISLTEKCQEDLHNYAIQLDNWITSMKPASANSILRFFDISELKVSST